MYLMCTDLTRLISEYKYFGEKKIKLNYKCRKTQLLNLSKFFHAIYCAFLPS